MACYFCSESGSCPAGRSAASAQVQCASADPGTPVCRPWGSVQRRQVSPCSRPRLGVSARGCETHRGHPSSSGRCGAQMPEGSLGDARSRGPGDQGSRNILGGPPAGGGTACERLQHRRPRPPTLDAEAPRPQSSGSALRPPHRLPRNNLLSKNRRTEADAPWAQVADPRHAPAHPHFLVRRGPQGRGWGIARLRGPRGPGSRAALTHWASLRGSGPPLLRPQTRGVCLANSPPRGPRRPRLR